MKKLLIAFFMIFSVSCSEDKEPTVEYRDYIPQYRWMDRQVYLAFSVGTSSEKNNELQKRKVKETLQEIAKDSNLGDGYFSFTEVDEALLQPIIESGQSELEYKSFVLIWPDAEFNNFVLNQLGGSVPDQNAVAVINASFKRKFYMIFKASCFVQAAACNGINDQGLKAMVARQLGFLVGVQPKTSIYCSTNPDDAMCTALPTDDQWNDLNKQRWINTFNNQLETILNNPTFYTESTTAQ